MKERLLKHLAYRICRIFAGIEGRELVDSCKVLARFDTSIFRHDFITKQSFFDDQKIDYSNICQELGAFLYSDIERIGLTQFELKKAELIVTIEFENKKNPFVPYMKVPDPRILIRLDEDYDREKPPTFYRYNMKCECRLMARRKEFIDEYSDLVEWPV